MYPCRTLSPNASFQVDSPDAIDAYVNGVKTLQTWKGRFFSTVKNTPKSLRRRPGESKIFRPASFGESRSQILAMSSDAPGSVNGFEYWTVDIVNPWGSIITMQYLKKKPYTFMVNAPLHPTQKLKQKDMLQGYLWWPNKQFYVITCAPRKTNECPLKINGWFRCISYWFNSAILGDEFVIFRGCTFSWIWPNYNISPT